MVPLKNVVILLILVVGGVVLQIFLSKREGKWFGLILPAITFFYSLLMVFQIAVFGTMRVGEVIGLVVTTFLFGNIPTVVLLGIYFGCREKMKTRNQVDKINIQDLE